MAKCRTAVAGIWLFTLWHARCIRDSVTKGESDSMLALESSKIPSSEAVAVGPHLAALMQLQARIKAGGCTADDPKNRAFAEARAAELLFIVQRMADILTATGESAPATKEELRRESYLNLDRVVGGPNDLAAILDALREVHGRVTLLTRAAASYGTVWSDLEQVRIALRDQIFIFAGHLIEHFPGSASSRSLRALAATV